MTARHNCYWPHCTTIVPPSQWGCTKHFLLLPKHLREAIKRTYVADDVARHKPSPDYLKASRAVQDWVRHNMPAGS